jgi:hypothetical protein
MTAKIVKFESLKVKKARLYKELEKAFYEVAANMVEVNNQSTKTLLEHPRVKRAAIKYNEFIEKYCPECKDEPIVILV